MPYPAEHRKEVRKRIIDSARRLFNRFGFESVSITQIMAGAELTHGGFYAYFQSKSDLYVEVLNCFFTDPEWKNCWEGACRPFLHGRRRAGSECLPFATAL
jgi:TetR/AcrR family transcriptional regulator, transcriptional repressor for nem operon